MISELLTYEDTVGVMLHELIIEEPFVIESKVKPANREKFISVVKSYIDRNMGNSEGYAVEFNSDYSKVRKINFVISKKTNHAEQIKETIWKL